MDGESPEPASTPTGAVFLSYASQDADAAAQICQALRSAGIEVWVDQSELRGGDVWDHRIRREIHDCTLFIPVISASTASRREGYFRLEWDLADQRSHRMARDQPFIVPVCLDLTPGTGADVPESFHRVQWTRLPAGETSPAFIERIRRLLSAKPAEPPAPNRSALTDTLRRAAAPGAAAPRQSLSVALLIALAVAVIGLGYFAVNKFLLSKQAAHGAETSVAVDQLRGAAESAIPEKSIAVLPFLDMSENRDQEYFSDGLSEELIDHLVHSADLKVIARVSSFQFKGRNEDVRSIAHQLGVTHVLEGSVRKDGPQLRITAQLIRGSDGVHLWSQTYDRSLVDVFKVQDEIADKVSQALRVALLYDPRAGNREPDVRAYNLVLQGNYFKARRTLRDVEKAVQLYQQAIDINPDYALAWARLAGAYLTEEILRGPPSEDQNRRLLDALDRALRLDPNLAWAYYTRGGFEMNVTWNWAAAQADAERIREVDPRFHLLPSALGDIALVFGDVNRAIESYLDALARNPLDSSTLDSLGAALCAADRLEQCLQTRLSLLQVHPELDGVHSSVGVARLYLGQFAASLQAIQNEPDEDYRLSGLAVVYWAMGRRAESNAALDSLTNKFASTDAYGIAAVHAYRGEIDDAFRWLDRAYRGHDHRMLLLKTDRLLRNLHADSRFQALLIRMGLVDRSQRRTSTL